ncbi:MAG: alpha/beta hydrolase [Desulfovibrionaceae bacterium]
MHTSPPFIRAAFLAICLLAALPAAALAAQSAPVALPAAAPTDGYSFPELDAVAATVLGTPSRLMPPLPDDVPVETRSLPAPDRYLPGIFSHQDGMRYTVALHGHPAPLVFVIAGTGACHNSGKMLGLLRYLYASGVHVACLSSPTCFNFIVSASRTRVPGYVPDDIEDLYAAMRAVAQDLGRDAAITGYRITGYSLGALHAAFLARLDDERGAFRFDRVLCINPPVSLKTSALLLDRMFLEQAPDPIAGQAMVDRILAKASAYYKNVDHFEADADLPYRLQAQAHLTDAELRTIIGLSFRLSSMNMVFASDVCTGAGYLVPRGTRLGLGDSLRPYFEAAVAVNFADYITEYLVPWLAVAHPERDGDSVMADCSLESIADWLAHDTRVRLIHNADDIILTPANLDFFRATFGDRATIYPRGGHCGNLFHTDTVRAITRYLGAPATGGTP